MERKLLDAKDDLKLTDAKEASVLVYSQEPYSGFGKVVRVDDLNNDDVPDLVVGAPGQQNKGCLYIFLGNIKLMHLKFRI